MYAIDVIKLTDQKDKMIFSVIVAQGDNEYDFQVTLSLADYERLSGGKITAAELIKKTFLFLLDQETPRKILSNFDISQVKLYFPLFEEDIYRY